MRTSWVRCKHSIDFLLLSNDLKPVNIVSACFQDYQMNVMYVKSKAKHKQIYSDNKLPDYRSVLDY